LGTAGGGSIHPSPELLVVVAALAPPGALVDGSAAKAETALIPLTSKPTVNDNRFMAYLLDDQVGGISPEVKRCGCGSRCTRLPVRRWAAPPRTQRYLVEIL
jgi:hypothetical protein